LQTSKGGGPQAKRHKKKKNEEIGQKVKSIIGNPEPLAKKNANTLKDMVGIGLRIRKKVGWTGAGVGGQHQGGGKGGGKN